ncbi:MAG: hypothetical protein LBN01_03325 [Endomicrobium sp.]|nr:hypothetical protein [Endomicrobium sp.]
MSNLRKIQIYEYNDEPDLKITDYFYEYFGGFPISPQIVRFVLRDAYLKIISDAFGLFTVNPIINIAAEIARYNGNFHNSETLNFCATLYTYLIFSYSKKKLNTYEEYTIQEMQDEYSKS